MKLTEIALAIFSSCVDAEPDLLPDVCLTDYAFPRFTSDQWAVQPQVPLQVTPVNVEKFPGLNILGVSMARIDYAPGCLNRDCVHALRGIVCGIPNYCQSTLAKTIKAGEVFGFPRGLVHFQKNNGYDPVAVISAFNSQLPGTQAIAATLFTSTPTVTENVLSVAFRIDKEKVEKNRAKLDPMKS